MNFIYSLFSKVNLNYVVLFLRISHSQSYFALFMYCSLLRQIIIRGAPEDLPSQILSTKFLMLI